MAQIVINSLNYTDYSYIAPYIRYCEEDRYQRYWELPSRVLGDYEFVFITKGTGRFTVGGCIYEVNPDDLIFLKPGIEHSAESLQLPFEFLCMHFDLYVSGTASIVTSENQLVFEAIPQKPVKYCKAGLDYPDFATVENSKYLKALFKRIIQEVRNKQKGYNIIIKALFIDVLCALFREIDHSMDEEKYPDEIVNIMEFIRSNYMKKLYLTDAAAYVHLHHTYVSALFKKHTGVTFTEFLTLHRLTEARKLLLESDKKLEVIAASTGFCDIHHFSKVFKAHEGLSPSQYRQICNY